MPHKHTGFTMGAAILVAGCFATGAFAQQAPPRSAEELRAAAEQRTRVLLSAPISPDSASELALMQSRARQYDQSMQLQIEAVPIDIAAEARRAWFSAVAARQAIAYAESAFLAADAAAGLAGSMLEKGNASSLTRLREQVISAEASVQLLRARQKALAARESLTRIMGVASGSTAFQLPDALPEIPDSILTLADAEARAFSKRIDRVAAKQNVAGTATALGLTRQVGSIDVLGSEGAPGVEVPGRSKEFTFPLYDFAVAHPKAEALYRTALARAGEIALYARSEVRENHAAYSTAYEIARLYRHKIVPMRATMSEEMLLRFHGMLIGVFELLADTRERIAAANLAVEAQRDFWIADTDLRQALAGPVSQIRRLPNRE
jgi:outer membrane protein TolC